MSLLEIIEFEIGHCQYIGDPTDLPTIVKLASRGPCRTIRHGDKYLVAFGLHPLHPRSAQAWMLVNPEYRYTYAKTILRHAQEELERWQISEGFNRVQITIEFANAGFVRWSKHLDFQMEGLMRQFGQDGQDHFLMARIR